MRAKGITLIEVVASLVLIATTVTVLLTAHARSLNQLQTTREQQVANGLAHELITAWKLDPTARHTNGEGRFVSHPGWRWRTATVPVASTHRLGLQEVTLTLYRTTDEGQEHLVSTYHWLERENEP